MAVAATLSPDAEQMPIKALNPSTRSMLAQNLDASSQSTTKDGLRQDWTGLAELMDIGPQEIDNLEHERNPREAKTHGILMRYSTETVKSLWQLLVQLERHDILESNTLTGKIETDCESYKQRRKEMMTETQQRHTPQHNGAHQDAIRARDEQCDPYEHVTVHDVLNRRPGERHIIYDAFISYCQEDFPFVKHLIKLAEEKMNLKLCINARDLLPGVNVHYVTANIIAHRCRKFIAIMSPEYLVSAECDFQVKIALALSPGAQKKILIPIKYRDCEMPDALKHIAAIDYTQMVVADWFCRRLGAILSKTAPDVTVSRQITGEENKRLLKIQAELLPDLPDIPTSTSTHQPKVPKFKGQGNDTTPQEHEDGGAGDDENDTCEPETLVMKTAMTPHHDRCSNNGDGNNGVEQWRSYYEQMAKFYSNYSTHNHNNSASPMLPIHLDNYSESVPRNDTPPPEYGLACESPPSYRSSNIGDYTHRPCPHHENSTPVETISHRQTKETGKINNNVVIKTVTRFGRFCKVKLNLGSKKSLNSPSATTETSITTTHDQMVNPYSLQSIDITISPAGTPDTSNTTSAKGPSGHGKTSSAVARNPQPQHGMSGHTTPQSGLPNIDIEQLHTHKESTHSCTPHSHLYSLAHSNIEFKYRD